MSTRFARGFAWNHLYKFSEYGLTALYSILIMRAFGPELAGNYAVYLSISAALAVIGSVGVDGALLRYIPRMAGGERVYGDKEYGGLRHFLQHLLAFRLAVTLGLSVLIILAFAVLPTLLPSYANALGSIRTLTPFLLVYAIGQSLTAFSTFSLIGLLKTKSVFIVSVIVRSLIVVAGGALVLSGTVTIQWAAGLHSVTALVNGLLLLSAVYRQIERERSSGLLRESRTVISDALRFLRSPTESRSFLMMPFMLYGLATWGNDILSTVLGRQPDILMLRAMLGENARDIGLYQCASMIVIMTEYVFLFGLGHTLVSVFSELAHDDERRTNRKAYPRLSQARKDIAGFQTVTTAPLFSFMMLFAPVVIRTIYGTKYHGAEPMVVISVGILFGTVVLFGGGMHITSLVAIGKERWVFRNRLTWGIVNVIINYMLIRHWGGFGAIIGTQCCNAGACVTEWWYAGRLIGNSTSIFRIAPVTIIGALSAGIAYWVVSSTLAGTVALLQLLCGGGITLVLTLAGYIVFRLPDAQRVLEKLRHILPSKEPTLQV